MLRMNAFCGAVGLLVPPLRHEQVIKELHDIHPGIALNNEGTACSLVRWPNTDADLERMVQSCCVCQESCDLSPKHFCFLGNTPSPLDLGYI